MWLPCFVHGVRLWLPFVVAALWLVGPEIVEAASRFPIILVVSIDGFKPDYVDDCLTPTIVRLRSSGVSAPYMRNVFPTKTLPNHHSMATGVHAEVHGVLDSLVYASKDGCSNRTLLDYGYDLYHYDNSILPIWTLNQLGGKDRHSGVMMWPGSEFSYGCKKTLPTYSHKLNMNMSFEDRIDIVISWLDHPTEPANFVMLYFEEPDLHAHAFGIDSPEVRKQIKKADNALNYLNNQLLKHDLDKLVTVFVVSDHGMVNLIQKNIVNLDEFVDNSTYVRSGYSPVLQIFPNEGKEKDVLSGLLRAHQAHQDQFDVYNEGEIPNTWFYKNSNRTPPILVVAREGYAFQDFYKSIEDFNKANDIEPNPRNRYGIHGYSNSLSSMHPFFFAWGPLLKTKTVLNPFNNTELYPLWAHVLGLELEHEVFSTPNLSMLLSSKVSPTLFAPREMSERSEHASYPTVPHPLSIGNQSKGGAPLWMYWFSGLIAILLLIIITGMIVYFCRDFQQANTDPRLTQHPRTSLENKHLLVSESEEELTV